MITLDLQIGPGCPGCALVAGELQIDVAIVLQAAGFLPTALAMEIASQAIAAHCRRRHPGAILITEFLDDEHPPTF